MELLTPIQDGALKADVMDGVERCFADDTNAWTLGADGEWTRIAADPERPDPRSVHREMMLGHTARAAEGLPT